MTLVGSLALPGCSSFERDWELAASAAGGNAQGLEGRWQGTWKSTTTGHGGGLRALITRESDGLYATRYHATYGKALTFEYTVLMAAALEGASWKFIGNADLGPLAGGIYDYAGTVTGDTFQSTYKAAGDQGTFEMARAR